MLITQVMGGDILGVLKFRLQLRGVPMLTPPICVVVYSEFINDNVPSIDWYVLVTGIF